MTSRSHGAAPGLIIAAVAASVLASGPAWAAEDDAGPDYSYLEASYEWTDVKYGIDPSVDPRYNNGSYEGTNIGASIGVLDWLHVLGEYFDGDCSKCGTNGAGAEVDQSFKGYQVGAGINIGFDRIGWSDRTDFVLRGYYVDVDQSDLNTGSPSSSLTGDGWAGEAVIRSQISPAAEFEVGYAYQDVGSVKNRDVTIGLNYRLRWNVALLAKGIIFDDDTGFRLGLRWYWGDQLFGGRDSIVR